MTKVLQSNEYISDLILEGSPKSLPRWDGKEF